MVPFEMDRVVVISVAQILCPVARIVRLNVATIKKNVGFTQAPDNKQPLNE